MTIELSKHVIDTIADAVVKKIQEPKTGYWKTYTVNQGGIDEEWLECSECKWSNALLIPRNYCPKCGTRMESE